jgi:anti-sigma-K factor RskA
VNIQDYISSGIIESYVLGLASPEDSAEFERMCATHSEIRDARNAFEIHLEASIQQQKIEPPRELKSRIFSRIGMESDALMSKPPIKKPVLVPRIGFAKYVAAASLLLLAGSVALNFYLLSEYKKSIARNNELIAAQTQVATANQVLSTKLQTYEDAMSLMKNPLMAIIKMPGLPNSPAPSSMATVYWNTDTKDVYLLVNKLPVPVPEKQYQLWAIVDGKPVDAGVFDIHEGLSFVKLKTIPKAEAFAITLEKKGGSPAPTMDAMYVMGRVTG